MPTRSVELAAALKDAILAEAAGAFPRECCGLLEGVRDGGVFRVRAVHPVANTAMAADRFEIDPAAHLAVRKAARARGQAVIGCYHSHPDGRAQPSATDLAGAGENEFLWLIAAGGELVAFVYRDLEFVGADWVTSSG